MERKRQTFEEIIEKKVSKLREEERARNEELIQIQKELRRHETALECLPSRHVHFDSFFQSPE